MFFFSSNVEVIRDGFDFFLLLTPRAIDRPGSCGPQKSTWTPAAPRKPPDKSWSRGGREKTKACLEGLMDPALTGPARLLMSITERSAGPVRLLKSRCSSASDLSVFLTRAGGSERLNI